MKHYCFIITRALQSYKKLSTNGTLIEPLMTKVTRFLGIEQTCERISLPAAVSLIDQAIPVVPTVKVSRLLLVFVDPQPKYFYSH